MIQTKLSMALFPATAALLLAANLSAQPTALTAQNTKKAAL